MLHYGNNALQHHATGASSYVGAQVGVWQKPTWQHLWPLGLQELQEELQAPEC